MLAVVLVASELLIVSAVTVVLTWMFLSGIRSASSGAPFVPMKASRVHPLLAAMGLTGNDLFFDMGCGDARVLECAVRDFGVRRAVGYDVAWWPLWLARRRIRRAGLGGRVTLQQTDARTAPVSEATAVYLYLYPRLVNEVAGHLAHELRRGARVLCPAFPIDTRRHPRFRLIRQVAVDSISAYLYETA